MRQPTPKELADACEGLQLIPYYPKEQHSLVLKQLSKFISDQSMLEWFVDAAVNSMPRWMGIGELRGLWCQKRPPLDGVEADSNLPGYTPADNEARVIEEHARIKDAERKKLT
jgi:hypothetical protein